MLRVAGTVSDSIVDGPGLRFTVFVQGCPHHCPGCHNPETHSFAGGTLVPVDQLAQRLAGNPLLAGLTLSGGEPMEQAGACTRLAEAAHRLGLNVWTYTGYAYEQLLEQARPDQLALLAETDVLVDGPFLLEQKSYEMRFRGSRNQRLIDLNETRRTGRTVLWTQPDPLAHFKRPES